MKLRVKGTILGGLWGFVSLIGAAIPGLSGRLYEAPIVNRLIFSPAFVSFYIFVNILNSVGTPLILLAYLLPILIGAFVGGVIGYFFTKDN